jgi:L-rhamnose isomerase/sugar isomerase
MLLNSNTIASHNADLLKSHTNKLVFTASEIAETENIIQKLIDFQIAIPSWALGTGGTRFGRFPGGGEPRSLEEKIEDVGLLHALNNASGAISLHIPWDIPTDYQAIKNLASQHGLKFDAVNSNTFQDQTNQEYTYKYGSLQNVNKAIRRSGGKTNYWDLRPFLPKETAGYVPAFIAATYVMHYAKEHGQVGQSHE